MIAHLRNRNISGEAWKTTRTHDARFQFIICKLRGQTSKGNEPPRAVNNSSLFFYSSVVREISPLSFAKAMANVCVDIVVHESFRIHIWYYMFYCWRSFRLRIIWVIIFLFSAVPFPCDSLRGRVQRQSSTIKYNCLEVNYNGRNSILALLSPQIELLLIQLIELPCRRTFNHPSVIWYMWVIYGCRKYLSWILFFKQLF